jgi:hypothetical protein
VKRIQDIKPIKKKPRPEPEAVFEKKITSSEISFDSPEFAEEGQSAKIPRQRLSFFYGKLFLAFVIISAFWLFSLQRTKTILAKDFSGLEDNFTSLSENISKKDLPKLSDQITEINSQTESAVLTLQSTGQDIYCLNLIYPKEKSSKSTVLIDGVRSAHLLTSSFIMLKSDGGEEPTKTGTSYLDKINAYFFQISEYNSSLSSKIKYAGFLANTAEELTSSADFSQFSDNEKQPLLNLRKLSETSSVFFDYLVNLPNEISDSFAFSGGEKSYLILFQNNSELRPGGGFIGSFARIDFKDGQVKTLDFEKNIYTLDKEFLDKGNIVTPPDEIKTLTSNWSMRDSNMSADFSSSAKKVAWFYKQESGKEVDGVFALDTTFFRNLLKIVGPIPMPEYGLQVTDQNFLRDVQYQVEIGYFENKENWSENQPKKILADMMPKFINLLTQKGSKQQQISSEIVKAIGEKHLLFYFNNNKLEDLVEGAGASGRIAQASGDYFYISDANIGGYKSSLNIAETVTSKIEIKSDGSVDENISIFRKHNGSYEWPDGINNNFTKVFLPLTSKIKTVTFVAGDNNPRSDATKATDQKYITSVEFGKTVLSFWQNTKPAETSQTDISTSREGAVLLNGDSFDYQITVQKQPGVEEYGLDLYIVYPTGWKPQNVDGYDAHNRQILLKEKIRSDRVFRLRFIRAQSG